MAVKTKPRYRGITIEVKYNPINPEPENKQEGRSTYPNPLYYGKPKQWWKFW